tara:strand:- start:205 stop:1185 length:981 start_codon:yes stop_codon:yes gene_type:complete
MYRGLTIGCGYYNNRDLILSGTVNDSLNMTKFLKSREFDVINMNDKNNNINSKLYPSRKNILEEIKNILEKSNDGDNVVISYAGHGTQTLYNINNIEEVDRRDEAIIPSDYMNDTDLIRDDEIYDLLKIYTKDKNDMKVFMLFDCCHSGTMADLKYTYEKDTSNNSFQTINNNMDDEIDAEVICLSGCKDKEVSYGDYIKFNNSQIMNQGIMTGSFLESINNNNTIFDIVSKMYLHTRRYKQHPQISSNKNIYENRKTFFLIKEENNEEKNKKKKNNSKSNKKGNYIFDFYFMNNEENNNIVNNIQTLPFVNIGVYTFTNLFNFFL